MNVRDRPQVKQSFDGRLEVGPAFSRGGLGSEEMTSALDQYEQLVVSLLHHFEELQRLPTD